MAQWQRASALDAHCVHNAALARLFTRARRHSLCAGNVRGQDELDSGAVHVFATTRAVLNDHADRRLHRTKRLVGGVNQPLAPVVRAAHVVAQVQLGGVNREAGVRDQKVDVLGSVRGKVEAEGQLSAAQPVRAGQVSIKLEVSCADGDGETRNGRSYARDWVPHSVQRPDASQRAQRISQAP